MGFAQPQLKSLPGQSSTEIPVAQPAAAPAGAPVEKDTFHRSMIRASGAEREQVPAFETQVQNSSLVGRIALRRVIGAKARHPARRAASVTGVGSYRAQGDYYCRFWLRFLCC
jgi:hypothetical protein